MWDGRNFFDTFHFTYRLSHGNSFSLYTHHRKKLFLKILQLKYFGSIVSEARTISVLLCLYYSNCCVSFSFCSGFLFAFSQAHPSIQQPSTWPFCRVHIIPPTHTVHTHRERPLSLHDLLEIKISFFSLPGCCWDCRSSERNFPSSSLPPLLYTVNTWHISSGWHHA